MLPTSMRPVLMPIRMRSAVPPQRSAEACCEASSSSVNRAPRQVLRDKHRLDAADQRLEPAEMTAVELLGAAQGQGDSVKAHFVVTPQLEKPVQRHRLGHVILGMH